MIFSPKCIQPGQKRGKHGKNKSRAAHVFGRSLVRRMALYDWLSTPRFLEGSPCDCALGLLSWRSFQLSSALTTSCPPAGMQRRSLPSAEESETSHFATSTLVAAR